MGIHVFDVFGTVNIKGVNQAKKDMKKFTDLAKTAASAIGKLTTAVMAVEVGIGVGLAKAYAHAVQEGSKVIEMENRFRATFKDQAQWLDPFLEAAANDWNINVNTLKNAAAQFGQLASGMGVGAEDAAKLAQQLSLLALDLSSFFDLPIDVAIQKISAGLAGEIEPLRRIGIDISTTALEIIAANQGITESIKDMSQGEKVLLRLDAMFKGAENATGDWLRTMKDAANLQKQLSDKVVEAWQDIGGDLQESFKVFIQMGLDIMEKFVNPFIETAGPAVAKIIGAWQVSLQKLIDGPLGGMFKAMEKWVKTTGEIAEKGPDSLVGALGLDEEDLGKAERAVADLEDQLQSLLELRTGSSFSGLGSETQNSILIEILGTEAELANAQGRVENIGGAINKVFTDTRTQRQTQMIMVEEAGRRLDEVLASNAKEARVSSDVYEQMIMDATIAWDDAEQKLNSFTKRAIPDATLEMKKLKDVQKEAVKEFGQEMEKMLDQGLAMWEKYRVVVEPIIIEVGTLLGIAFGEAFLKTASNIVSLIGSRIGDQINSMLAPINEAFGSIPSGGSSNFGGSVGLGGGLQRGAPSINAEINIRSEGNSHDIAQVVKREIEDMQRNRQFNLGASI